ncbi:MAG: cbb3-type cytochrome c oxidase subunit 3 [Minwuia sp.]|uniref:cbb3-type cytochrome c oxidase subunit 3 n=1 Tax=Minwuia sp. TaxID=2493630 RepID=UPI003A8C660F
MDHEIARHLADTWGLVLLVLMFLAAVGFLFRPGAKSYYRKCGHIPLSDDERPKS